MQPKSANTKLSYDKFEKVIIEQVSWQQAEQELRAVRTAVFIEEQLVTPEFEWDEIDADAIHLIASIESQPIACLRIIHHEKIGRMAVIKPWRGKGLGAALLLEAINVCKKHGSKSIYLSAQTHAIDFYKKAAFMQTSDVYTDVDIPHVDMRLDL